MCFQSSSTPQIGGCQEDAEENTGRTGLRHGGEARGGDNPLVRGEERINVIERWVHKKGVPVGCHDIDGKAISCDGCVLRFPRRTLAVAAQSWMARLKDNAVRDVSLQSRRVGSGRAPALR